MRPPPCHVNNSHHGPLCVIHCALQQLRSSSLHEAGPTCLLSAGELKMCQNSSTPLSGPCAWCPAGDLAPQVSYSNAAVPKFESCLKVDHISALLRCKADQQAADEHCQQALAYSAATASRIRKVCLHARFCPQRP